MAMKQEIYDIIRNDIPLRKKIAFSLGVENITVYGHAVRKSAKLIEYPIVKIIMDHTGKKENEIFENKLSKN